ncbi:HemK family protein methyltransferase [Candidatus Dojkabacteria bacterium]|nr:HemK family protein methyltransferase [Candidatus Dojkabacteria bacterium]
MTHSLSSFELVSNSSLTIFEKNLLSEYLTLNVPTTKKLNAIKTKLSKGYPVEYITGYTYFYGKKINITPDVLIPREETEILVSLVINIIKSIPQFTLIDIGTGSGAIMHSIGSALDGKNSIVAIGVDTSKPAIRVAKANTPPSSTVKYKYIHGDLFPKALTNIKGNLIITANLPYLDPLTAKVSPKTLKFEPHLALFSKHGYSHIVKLLKLLHKYNVHFRLLALEIEPGIAKNVICAAQKFFPDKMIVKETDTNRLDRFILIQ